MQRKLNLLMLLFSLIGGAVGFAVGEVILDNWGGDWPWIVVIGLYFGLLALFIGLSCLIAEMISPRLNGPSWKQRYMGTSWKLVVPATLVMIFVLGLGLEFAYEINAGGSKPVKDIALVIDNSGSMQQTDPDNGRYAAAKNMIDRMDSDNRVAVMAFNHETTLLQPFIKLKDQAAKDKVIREIDVLDATDGGTDINLALADTMKHIKDQGEGRGTMVVLLSDGFSEVDLNTALAPYKQKHIQVNTIGLSLVQAEGSRLLREIAQGTGGQYYDVQNANDLSVVFQKIYQDTGERTLLTKRTGPLEDSIVYLILRVAALALIGAGIGLALGLIFDNRYLARSFGVGGTVSGLLAGLMLEFGLTGEGWKDAMIRLLSCLVLAGVLALFTLVIPVKENGKLESGLQRPGSAGRSQTGFAGRPKNNSSRGF
ncbi:VWA domain-containing protein [Paenibacillus sp.]|jgi:Ca-activated chloride channel family protein|uniref:vWA domain-containing protein n=1 Tax=Paenibacillus sp. TaxID=58172 RepID=UPI00281EDC7E|nr:VWA domain-containing protein [Paenibacillus sp.]MDR0271619.1 VWA domain-containing protein [Paenibacillus sp.]